MKVTESCNPMKSEWGHCSRALRTSRREACRVDGTMAVATDATDGGVPVATQGLVGWRLEYGKNLKLIAHTNDSSPYAPPLQHYFQQLVYLSLTSDKNSNAA